MNERPCLVTICVTHRLWGNSDRAEASRRLTVQLVQKCWGRSDFIIFLFYSNLLMREFERLGMGQRRGLAWAIEDVFTAANLEIAMVAVLVGYILFEFFRKKSSDANVTE
jgi:hypothetical protein